MHRANPAGAMWSDGATHSPAAPGEAEGRALDLLAALGDVEVSADRLARLLGVADAADAVSTLEALQRRRLVEGDGERYRLVDTSMAESPAANAARAAWMPLVIAVLASDYEEWGAAPRAVAGDLELIKTVLEWASRTGCWSGAVRLVRAVDASLAMSRRWGAWESVLRYGLQAARATGDAAAEAWVRHQLGTRALASGDRTTVRSHLTAALRLREALGDRDGAAVTRHNLAAFELAATPR